jgi:hypothetical protein
VDNPHGSTVSELKVRAVGRVACRVGATNVGTAEIAVVLRIGDVVMHVSDERALSALLYTWAIAEEHMHVLPYRDEFAHLGATPGLYRVGALFDLQGHVTSAVAVVPEHGQTPKHVRVQFGPIIWQVCDREAWETVTDAVRRTLDLFKLLNH